MLVSNIRKRPDAHGRVLDVIDSIPRTIIRMGAAIGLGVAGNIIDGKIHSKDSRIFKWIGFGSACTIMMNQVIELSRDIFRFIAALQGSEAAVLEKYRKLSSPKETSLGMTETITTQEPSADPALKEAPPSTNFANTALSRPIDPDSIVKQKTEANSILPSP